MEERMFDNVLCQPQTAIYILVENTLLYRIILFKDSCGKESGNSNFFIFYFLNIFNERNIYIYISYIIVWGWDQSKLRTSGGTCVKGRRR